MIETMDALEAWWPPTLSPLGLGRTRLAWSTVAVASHSTRCSTSRRTSSAVRCSVEVLTVVLPAVDDGRP